MKKTCPKCKQTKDTLEYNKNKASKTGCSSYCIVCMKKYKNSRYDPHMARKQWLKGVYGLDYSSLEGLYNKQRGCCKICSRFLPLFGSRNNLVIDHDHVTGKIRGLLCRKCNLLLGQADDNVRILQNAINYLNNDKSEIQEES